MFGSLRRLPSGRWQARYRTPDGGRVTAPHAFETKRDAEQYLATIHADLVRGNWQDPRVGRITLAEWVDEYFANTNHQRPTTRVRDITVMQKHFLPPLGRKQL